MLPSSNALFVFDAAARNGSFTAAAAELNVTQPAVSRMLGQFEDHLGVRLFDRKAGRAVLTEEGELLYRRVLEGFRSIESGLVEIERRRKGTETVTLSVSSAFTTHWLMPRIDKLQKQFPQVDLRFQLISGALCADQWRMSTSACASAIARSRHPVARW
ncbi:DNA-binding transcriptional LysR family regulator [Bradyrhizobium sp. GM2.4]